MKVIFQLTVKKIKIEMRLILKANLLWEERKKLSIRKKLKLKIKKQEKKILLEN